MQVLPIGGVKEKVIAAKRSKVSTVLLPFDNKRDWDELDAAVQQDVDVVFCKEYSDVWAAVTQGTPMPTAVEPTAPTVSAHQ